MSKRTVENEVYQGLVETMAIPAELHEKPGGGQFASFGDVMPIHCADEEQRARLSRSTHHYCGVFSARVLAPLAELALVRLDGDTAEKVFINRVKRILLVSSDGRIATWRAAPSFESANRFLAGAPLVNRDGALVSVVTAKKGNHYAVSTFEGDNGYFETPHPWTMIDTPEGHLVYGDRTFASREELRDYIASLPPAAVSEEAPPRPVLQTSAGGAKIALVAHNGRQLAHVALHSVVTGAEYL